jgi:hypothetical protein
MYLADIIVVGWLTIGALLAVYLGGAHGSALEKAAAILYEDDERGASTDEAGEHG